MTCPLFFKKLLSSSLKHLLTKGPFPNQQLYTHKKTAESQHGTIVSALCTRTHSHISSLLPKRGANTAEDEDILFSLFSTFHYSSPSPPKILLCFGFTAVIHSVSADTSYFPEERERSYYAFHVLCPSRYLHKNSSICEIYLFSLFQTLEAKYFELLCL